MSAEPQETLQEPAGPEDAVRPKSPMITETSVETEDEDDQVDEDDPVAQGVKEHHEALKRISKLSFELFNKESQLSFL